SGRCAPRPRWPPRALPGPLRAPFSKGTALSPRSSRPGTLTAVPPGRPRPGRGDRPAAGPVPTGLRDGDLHLDVAWLQGDRLRRALLPLAAVAGVVDVQLR